eukprot:2933426-Rhodomonas_salina.6
MFGPEKQRERELTRGDRETGRDGEGVVRRDHEVEGRGRGRGRSRKNGRQGRELTRGPWCWETITAGLKQSVMCGAHDSGHTSAERGTPTKTRQQDQA